MWPHPDSIELNITTLFPEIFDKHDFLYFQLPGNRMSDFFASTNYLDASRKSKDVGKVFSAVQRAMQRDKYLSLQNFLKGKKNLEKLARAATATDVDIALDALFEVYEQKYGMARHIRTFYQRYIDEDGRQKLSRGMPRPASYKRGQYNDADGEVRVRIDFLVEHLRNPDTHAATYKPLPLDPVTAPLSIEWGAGNPRPIWIIYLTFDDFYELTRRAMARLWLQEYEDYWAKGGEQTIKKLIAEVKAKCDELNSKNS